MEEKQVDFDSAPLHVPCLTPSIPEASASGRAENPYASTRMSAVLAAETQVLTVDGTVDRMVEYCLQNNINNPVEILRCLQKEIVTVQPHEVTDVTQCSSGETNFILVDRNKSLETAFDELKSHNNYRVTLEVQFYGEVTKCIRTFGKLEIHLQ